MQEIPNAPIAALPGGRPAVCVWCLPASALTTDEADGDRHLVAGFTMDAVGSDPGLLSRGSDALVASFKS